MDDMNTKINLTWKGDKYVLEYDRNTVRILENAGFVLDEFLTKPMTNIELVFSGAFIKNHRNINQTTVDEIFKKVPDKNKLLVELRKMIEETYDSLLEEPDSSDEGNAIWEVVDLSPKKSEKK